MRPVAERLRPPAWVWALALLPRLILFGYVAAQPTRALIYADSFEYLALARNLALHHSFQMRSGAVDEVVPRRGDFARLEGWLQENSGPPFSPERYRTPGYPLLLALWSGPARLPVLPVALLQCLAGVLTVILCWHWAARLGGPRGAAWAAAFAALEPASVIHTPLLLTDTLAAGVLLLAMFLFWRMLEEPDDRPLGALGSGLSCCVGIMIRPVSLHLPLLLSGLLLRKRRCLLVFLLGVYLVPALWVVRNARLGSPVFSCMSGWSFANLPMEAGMIKPVQTQAERDRISCSSLGAAESSSRLFLRCLAAHPAFSGKLLAKRAFYLFEGTSLDMLVDMMRVGAPPAAAAVPPRRFQFQRDHPALVPLWIGGLALLLGLYAAFGKGCWRLFQDRRWTSLLLLSAGILYLVAVTIPLGGSGRYRIPIVPLLAVGASAAWARKENKPSEKKES